MLAKTEKSLRHAEGVLLKHGVRSLSDVACLTEAGKALVSADVGSVWRVLGWDTSSLGATMDSFFFNASEAASPFERPSVDRRLEDARELLGADRFLAVKDAFDESRRFAALSVEWVALGMRILDEVVLPDGEGEDAAERERLKSAKLGLRCSFLYRCVGLAEAVDCRAVFEPWLSSFFDGERTRSQLVNGLRKMRDVVAKELTGLHEALPLKRAPKRGSTAPMKVDVGLGLESIVLMFDKESPRKVEVVADVDGGAIKSEAPLKVFFQQGTVVLKRAGRRPKHARTCPL